MNKRPLSCLLLPMALMCSSFLSFDPTTPDLIRSKWISPINDNCFDSLCFTSDYQVMYYSCEHNLHAELGYKIIGDRIEIEAYSTSLDDQDSKMILIEEDGVLKQPSRQKNNFPKNFIKVPHSDCH